MAFAALLPYLPAAASAASSLISAFRINKAPEINVGQLRSEINQRINLEMENALNEVTANTRARLSTQGVGGSATISQAINNARARIRDVYERQRQQALEELERFNLGVDFQGQGQKIQRADEFLKGVTSLGFNIFASQKPEFFNPLLRQTNQMKELNAPAVPQMNTATNPAFSNPRGVFNQNQDMNNFQFDFGVE